MLSSLSDTMSPPWQHAASSGNTPSLFFVTLSVIFSFHSIFFLSLKILFLTHVQIVVRLIDLWSDQLVHDLSWGSERTWLWRVVSLHGNCAKWPCNFRCNNKITVTSDVVYRASRVQSKRLNQTFIRAFIVQLQSICRFKVLTIPELIDILCTTILNAQKYFQILLENVAENNRILLKCWTF